MQVAAFALLERAVIERDRLAAARKALIGGSCRFRMTCQAPVGTVATVPAFAIFPGEGHELTQIFRPDQFLPGRRGTKAGNHNLPDAFPPPEERGMRLDDEAESSNYEVRGPGGGGFGLPIGIPLGRGGLGCGSLIVIAIVSMIFGVNPLSLIGGGDNSAPVQQSQPASAPGQLTEIQHRSLKILGSTERVWGGLFDKAGGQYVPTTLVFYSGGTQAGCGYAQASMGPFYCPTDKRVYLDTAFFDELAHRFGAPGDFAQAYVIAHEVGHHVQDLQGLLDKVHARQEQLSEAESNALQVKVELQADCYAGVWAANDKNLLEPGDAQEGLRAAAAVGDDTLEKASQGYVVPESFTHGSAAQRQHWLEVGLETGDPAKCDTFGGRI